MNPLCRHILLPGRTGRLTRPTLMSQPAKILKSPLLCKIKTSNLYKSHQIAAGQSQIAGPNLKARLQHLKSLIIFTLTSKFRALTLVFPGDKARLPAEQPPQHIDYKHIALWRSDLWCASRFRRSDIHCPQDSGIQTDHSGHLGNRSAIPFS